MKHDAQLARETRGNSTDRQQTSLEVNFVVTNY